jgi:hypothetical protein
MAAKMKIGHVTSSAIRSFSGFIIALRNIYEKFIFWRLYLKYHKGGLTPTTPVTSTAISPVKMSIGRKSLINLRSEMIFLQGNPVFYIITFPELFFLNFSGMFRKAMIKPENDRNAEICRTWPTFALLPLRCPLSTKSEDYLSVWGVDGRKI